MRIVEILSRHRNDFSFICGCEHCGHQYRRGDGYADAYYCLRVVPGQHCPECGLNTYGEPRTAIGDRSPTGPGRETGPVHESPDAESNRPNPIEGHPQ
jgi:hypothetical protein